jgi:hypothetical protein
LPRKRWRLESADGIRKTQPSSLISRKLRKFFY